MFISIRIILPIFPNYCYIYFKGFINISVRREIVIFVTEYSNNSELTWKQECVEENTIFGHCCSYQPSNQQVFSASCLILENYNMKTVNIKHLVIQNEQVYSVNDCILMLYNYESVRHSESLCYVGDYISELKSLIQKELRAVNNSCDFNPKLKNPHWLTSSMFIQHLVNYVNLIGWLIHYVKKDKKVTLWLTTLNVPTAGAHFWGTFKRAAIGGEVRLLDSITIKPNKPIYGFSSPFKCTPTVSSKLEKFKPYSTHGSQVRIGGGCKASGKPYCQKFFEPPIRHLTWLDDCHLVSNWHQWVNVPCEAWKWSRKMPLTVKPIQISIKQGNLILAIVIDVLLGFIMLILVTQDKADLSSMLMGAVESLVNLLYSLLKWLMGSPAGLKLNNAFNKMLGKFFSYHIQLWWLFLDVCGEKLDIILDVYSYIGYLGFTFQAAMISDLICLATFHSYCIYVYAARLFNIQISGLVALSRLFFGRKYNPLRGGIDSCEYTNQELFVGTVAFTTLLLLLPTTTMYYFVFTLFRLLSLAVQYVLAKLIYFVQTLPLYAVSLWTLRSPKVAGKVLIEVLNDRKDSPLILKMNIFNKPIGELINGFRPPVKVPKNFDWANVLSNVFTGKQII